MRSCRQQMVQLGEVKTLICILTLRIYRPLHWKNREMTVGR